MLPVSVQIWRTSRYTVAEMPAEIDLSNAERIGERLLELVGAVHTCRSPIIIDLTRTTFCDVLAIRMLVRAHRHAAPAGRRLCLAVRPGGSVHRILDIITGIDGHIPTADDLGSAIAVVTALDEGDDSSPAIGHYAPTNEPGYSPIARPPFTGVGIAGRDQPGKAVRTVSP